MLTKKLELSSSPYVKCIGNYSDARYLNAFRMCFTKLNQILLLALALIVLTLSLSPVSSAQTLNDDDVNDLLAEIESKSKFDQSSM